MRRGYSCADRDVDHEKQAEAGSGSCGWGCVVAQYRHLLPSFAATRIASLKTGVSTLETRADSGPQVHPKIETRRPRMAEQMKELKEKVSQDGSGEAGRSLPGKGLLLPVAATAAAAAAAGLAAKKGPDLMKKLTGEANEEAEELGRKGAEGAKKQLGSSGGVAEAASKLLGGGGQEGGKTRRLPIQRWSD